MGDKQRARRPALKRTKPIRNWRTAVVSGPPFDGPVGPDVQNANRVVEEYLRAGEASARLFQGAFGTGAAGADLQDIAQRWVRAASDSMSFWLELMARSAGGTAPAPERQATSHPEAAKDPPQDGGLRVAVEVISHRPAKVTLDLRPHARGSRLCLDRLHPWGMSAPPLVGGTIDSSDDSALSLCLRIEPDQPAGVYNGVVLDEATSLPAGTISVEIRQSVDASTGEGRA